MTKADIAERIHQKLGMTISESKEALEAVLEIMKKSLESGDSLKITGFGSFVVKKKAARRGRNPQTAEPLILGARRNVSFKTSAVLKAAINRESAA